MILVLAKRATGQCVRVLGADFPHVILHPTLRKYVPSKLSTGLKMKGRSSGVQYPSELNGTDTELKRSV